MVYFRPLITALSSNVYFICCRFDGVFRSPVIKSICYLEKYFGHLLILFGPLLKVFDGVFRCLNHDKKKYMLSGKGLTVYFSTLITIKSICYLEKYFGPLLKVFDSVFRSLNHGPAIRVYVIWKRFDGVFRCLNFDPP